MLKTEILHVASGPPARVREAYEFWREHWAAEFERQSLEGIDARNSDDFRQSDLVRILRVDGKVAALMLVSLFDLTRAWDRQSSYFNGWPPEFFASGRGAKIRALRYFVVHPDFRRRPDVRAGAVILGLCLRDFVHSPDDRLIGMTLKENGAHLLTAKFGMARVGEPGQTKHGVGVEYVQVTKGEVNTSLIAQLMLGVSEQTEIGAGERGGEDLPGFVAHEKARGFA